jgi:hypothetical protein
MAKSLRRPPILGQAEWLFYSRWKKGECPTAKILEEDLAVIGSLLFWLRSCFPFSRRPSPRASRRLTRWGVRALNEPLCEIFWRSPGPADSQGNGPNMRACENHRYDTHGDASPDLE